MEFTVSIKQLTDTSIKYTTEELVNMFCTDYNGGTPEEQIDKLKKLIALLIEALPTHSNYAPTPVNFVRDNLLPFNTELK